MSERKGSVECPPRSLKLCLVQRESDVPEVRPLLGADQLSQCNGLVAAPKAQVEHRNGITLYRRAIFCTEPRRF